jgi:hypothetical protein
MRRITSMKDTMKKPISIILIAVVAVMMCGVYGTVSTSSAYAASKTKVVKINKKSVKVEVKHAKNLKAKYGKKNVTKKAKWYTSNKKLVTVKKGKVNAVKCGTAYVWCKFKGHKSKKVKVKVTSCDTTKFNNAQDEKDYEDRYDGHPVDWD